MKHFYFYQNCVSPHQVPLLRALAECPQVSVSLLAPTTLTPERASQGWRQQDIGNISLILGERLYNPSPPRRPAPPVDQNGKLAINVHSGIRAYRPVFRALRRNLALRQPNNLNGVFVEPHVHGGLRLLGFPMLVRRLLSRLDAIRFADRIDFILATGQLGVDWYVHAGFPSERVFEFGYCVASPEASPLNVPEAEVVPPGHRGRPTRVIFLAQLTPRKALDLLLQALAGIRDPMVALTIAGAGSPTAYRTMAQDLGVADCVTFRGALPYPEAMASLQSHDLLVLPSRADGWGAVVNEALTRGVPAIVSDACGAASLVEGLLGQPFLFRSNDVGALEVALRDALAFVRSPTAAEHRLSLRCRAQQCCGPEAMSSYLLEIVRYVSTRGTDRPVAPWRTRGTAP